MAEIIDILVVCPQGATVPAYKLSPCTHSKVIDQSTVHFPTNLFPDKNPCFDLSIVFNLHIRITHRSGKIRINLRVQRSMVLVAGQGRLHLPTNLFADNNFLLDLLFSKFVFRIKTLYMYQSSPKEEPY